MKIEKKDNNIIVFLNKKIMPIINIKNKIELEKNFQKIFQKLNSIYNLDLNGSYEIKIYLNQYGMILEIEKNEIDYFDYYDTIDMHLNLSKYKDILYQTNNIINNVNIYVYEGYIYIEPQNIDYNQLGRLIENSEIIYGEKANIIKKKGNKIEYKVEKIK